MPGDWELIFTASFENKQKLETMYVNGEKGSAGFSATAVGEPRVALFFALVRGLSSANMSSLLTKYIVAAKKEYFTGNVETASAMLADLFVLAFQTRDCRGGKGERDLFYEFFYQLFLIFPKTARALLPLIPTYGYHKDYVNLLEFLSQADSPRAERLQTAVMKTMGTILINDLANINVGGTSMSLCSKYLPREGNAFARKHKELFHKWVQMLFPTASLTHALHLYRRKLALLAPYIDTVEVKMCDHQYSNIDFNRVPSVAQKRYRKAFLNERRRRAIKYGQELTGNRYPHQQDRVLCRLNLMAQIKAKKVKGKQLYPHEIIHPMINDVVKSKYEEELLNCQWVDLRNHISEKLQTVSRTNAATDPMKTSARVDMGKLVPLVDVSDSMSGVPMQVAIALGILISELNHPAFRDRMLTFETTPHWIAFDSKSMPVSKKVEVVKRAPWGGTTNIEAAMALIAQVVLENRLPPSDIPDLIIFSDMQFDEATGHSVAAFQAPVTVNSTAKKSGRLPATQYHRIQRRFHDLGLSLIGQPYPPPRVIFWNLRANTPGFPARVTMGNVQMLSGYSPALFKYITEGVVSVDLNGKVDSLGTTTVNPYSTLRQVLDDARYFMVRQVLAASEEGPLAHYNLNEACGCEEIVDEVITGEIVV